MSAPVNAIAGAATERVLMLGLGGEYLAIDAAIVREIMDPAPVTTVPGARSFVSGVINVRGEIVPLADLRVRLGMPATEHGPDTRFVVIEVEAGDEPEPILVTVVADKVHEVCDLDCPPASTVPRIGMAWPPELIRGVALWKDDFVILPNLPALLGLN
ncbi:chemotaxis protein CheW [uncultured Alsobacter sp.]|uniref:chemotaxis protein CheW n=1 Tax=uncultured Alsobacter sp. TaxID=1748258 RepID=UPI0025D87968|nr:chemotaxis protein CheW [uncultured Alsobacter sp.]